MRQQSARERSAARHAAPARGSGGKKQRKRCNVARKRA